VKTIKYQKDTKGWTFSRDLG